MNSPAALTKRERILGGLWGSLVGDALGVPVEFKDRATVQADPVKEMRGFGSHRQPAGTWSDDSSLLLCSTDSLLHHDFDTEDMGKRFVRWYQEELWTPHGKVFDIGVTTSRALARITSGVRPELVGGDDQFSNGNGSLMRIIPVSLRFANSSDQTDARSRPSRFCDHTSTSSVSNGLWFVHARYPRIVEWQRCFQCLCKRFVRLPLFLRTRSMVGSRVRLFSCCFWRETWLGAQSPKSIQVVTFFTPWQPASGAC